MNSRVHFHLFSYSSITSDDKLTTTLTGITRLVEYPIQVKSLWELGEQNKPVLLPVSLTEHEQRKLGRQKRAEVLKERQEKIRLPRTFIPAVGTAPYTTENGALNDRKRRFTALIFTLFHRNPSVRITTAVLLDLGWIN